MLRRNKLILLALAAALLLVTLAACSGGEQDWNGTFYNYLDENHILAYTFERDGEGEYLDGREIEITTDNGFSRISVGMSAWIEKGNVAEDDDRGYRYTLKGDVLTVKYMDDDEVFGTDFSGTYTRGASIEETFDLADDNEGSGNSEDGGSSEDSGSSIAFDEFYYWDGDADDNSLYFFDDGTVDADTPDGQTYEYEYTIRDGIVRIEVDGSEQTLTIIDEYTLETEGGGRYIRLGGADNSPDSDIDGNAGASAADSASPDTPRITGVFLNGEDNDDILTFYDDYTASWYSSDFEFEIVGDSILFEINDSELEIQIRDDNTLYWELFDVEYVRAQ
jgi:hypothetical protein